MPPPDPSDLSDSALWDVAQVADYLNCSKRTVYRLADGGKMPPPIRLGGLVRWRTDLLHRWVAEGCPPPRKAAQMGRGA